MLLVNQILHNRYRIMRQLGHGGMGAVYEAHDNVFDTTCAVKEIMLDLSKSSNPKQQEMLLRAFEREAKILAKIKHEVVPHVRDYFTDENRQYLVMELVEGKDLGDLLEDRKSPFPLEDVVRWTEQLLDGLDYLHTQNPPIYHRDLKPQNLKITPRGKIKLLDFGIAKGGAEPPNSTTINNQTFVAATLNYSPLEQIFRVLDPVFREVLTQRFEARLQAVILQNADARSDLYALGATVYHLLTGVLPIDALKRTLEVWSNKPDPLMHPTSLNSHIPPEISNVLLKAMELNHEKSYVSAIEMQQALQSALDSVKAREANQAQNTLEMSNQTAWQIEQERLRLEAQSQQQTRLPSEQTFQDAATQQIPADKLPQISQQSVSEETIQGGAIGYAQGFGQTSGNNAPPTPNSPFNTGGNSPFNTGNQYQTGNNPQPTEMVNFAGVSTGGNIPPPNFPNNPTSTGGAMNSNNPISPNPAFAQHYGVQQPQKSSKIWWAIPILLLLFLGVAGAGGGVYLWYQSNNPGTDNVNTASPTATVSASKTPTSTASPSPSPTESAGKEETPSPTAVPTATKPVVTNPTPVKTPPPVVKTPKPKNTTPKKNSDCIFTGDC